MGLRSRSGSGSRQSAQSELSAAASTAIVSQTSASKALHRARRPLDLVLAVSGRGEERLELRRGEVDALLEQVPEERAVAIRIAPLGVLEVAHRPVAHEEREQRAHTLHVDERGERFLENGRPPLELVVDGAIAQAPQDREAGGGRERVPGERARLVDRTGGREQ